MAENKIIRLHKTDGKEIAINLNYVVSISRDLKNEDVSILLLSNNETIKIRRNFDILLSELPEDYFIY